MTDFVQSAALKNCWYPVIDSADLVDSPVAIRLLDEDLVIWRSETGAVAVAPDRCPHREAPLSIGSLENGVLSCAYHGWDFGGDGRCVSIPSSGSEATIPPAAHLSCRSAEERYGLVWVCPGTPDVPIPEIAQEADPAFRRINTGVEAWAVSTPRMVDNFLDVSHFPYVHTGTFGGAFLAGQFSAVAAFFAALRSQGMRSGRRRPCYRPIQIGSDQTEEQDHAPSRQNQPRR